MYKDHINRLATFLQYMNTNPGALLVEGRDFGQTVGRLIGQYLRNKFFLEPSYQKKGELLGFVFGIVISEIALALLGGVAAKAIAKTGIFAGARMSAPLLKNTPVAGQVSGIMDRAGATGGLRAVSAGEKMASGVTAGKNAGEVVEDIKALAQTGSRRASSPVREAEAVESDIALATGKSAAAPRTLPHKEMLKRFVDMFQRSGPPADSYVVHPTMTDFNQAYNRAAGGKNGATIGFFNPKPPPTIHLPPGSDELTIFHEALHWAGNQGGVRQAVGQFLEEGLTEWLARRALGVKVARHPYNQNVALVEILAQRFGVKNLERAFLHGEWPALFQRIERSLGSSGQAEEVFQLLRRVGPGGQESEKLGTLIDLIFPGSAVRSPQQITPAAIAGMSNPVSARPIDVASSVSQASKLPESADLAKLPTERPAQLLLPPAQSELRGGESSLFNMVPVERGMMQENAVAKLWRRVASRARRLPKNFEGLDFVLGGKSTVIRDAAGVRQYEVIEDAIGISEKTLDVRSQSIQSGNKLFQYLKNNYFHDLHSFGPTRLSGIEVRNLAGKMFVFRYGPIEFTQEQLKGIERFVDLCNLNGIGVALIWTR
jgi:hypothetical protein